MNTKKKMAKTMATTVLPVSLQVDTYITFSTYRIYVFFRKLTLTFRSGSLRFDLVRDF